jgi:hypothetical protein
MNRFFRLSAVVPMALVVIFGSILMGCASKDRAVTAAAEEPVYTVQIDRRDNGAATGRRSRMDDANSVLPRSLAFEMVGESGAAVVGGSEARASATQAAILDAFVRSLIEARRTRGQSTADFSARLGPRLAITHKSLPVGYFAEISLITGGVENTLTIKNGALESPVADMKLIRKVFAETNGEFSLLSTDWSSSDGTCQARVACYMPAGLEEHLAAQPAAAEENAPIP